MAWVTLLESSTATKVHLSLAAPHTCMTNVKNLEATLLSLLRVFCVSSALAVAICTHIMPFLCSSSQSICRQVTA